MAKSSIKFIILFPGRCGGTWIYNITGSSHYVQIHEERMGRYSDKIQQVLFAEFTRISLYDNKLAYGFITKLKDITNKDNLRKFIHEHGIKIIFIQRNNFVKQALSKISGELLYKKTGIYHVFKYGNENIARTESIEVDPVILFNCTKNIASETKDLNEFIDSLNVHVLKIIYEEMQDNIKLIVDKIYAFLELPDKENAIIDLLKKNMNDDLKKAIKNYDEVMQHFKGSDYEIFFN